MFQGTGSGVGKSIIATAFCRILAREGVKVAPFKAQNMALNSFVTLDGFEMGRAQVYQAEACGLEPDVRMNPILLKPSTDSRSQVIVMGKPVDTAGARDYYTRYAFHREVVRSAFDSLAAEFDVIVIEGAGSPAEINLQKTDVVNMSMALYSQSPVVLIGDIDRGGVFAWLKGTYDLVPDESKRLIAGFLVNKFRGDVSLLRPGLRQFREILDVPFLGVLPWFHGIEPDQEDGVFVNAMNSGCSAGLDHDDNRLYVKVIKLPRISNFTDFSPFSAEEDLNVEFVESPSRLGRCHLLIIPGSKATLSDMKFLEKSGWCEKIRKIAGKVMVSGICGGYQMLGKGLEDPDGVEGHAEIMEGLGLLDIKTVMRSDKHLKRTGAVIDMYPVIKGGVNVSGYEIHMGETFYDGEMKDKPINPDAGPEFGSMDSSGMVWGTYLHGIFDNDSFRHNLINFLKRKHGIPESDSIVSYQDYRIRNLDMLADWFANAADIDALKGLCGL